MAKNIAAGTAVVSTDGFEYVYKGLPELEGMVTVTFEMFTELKATISTDPAYVMPLANFVMEDLNVKDPRIEATKKRNGWSAEVFSTKGEFFTHVTAKTKRDTLKKAALSLAILDWHNA